MPEQVNIPELVRRAVAQPVIVHHGDDTDLADALNEWGLLLARQWPLWALRGEAFRALNGQYALTYPLSSFVRSICRDERIERSSGADGLAALVDHRRIALVSGGKFAWDTAELSAGGEARSWWSFGSIAFPSILEGPLLAAYEPDTQYSIGGYISPYEEIGIELVRLLDDRNAARSGTADRSSANRRLNEFLIRVGGGSRGRPAVLRRATARKLAEQGFSLFTTLWGALAERVQVNPRAARVLQGLAKGDAEPEEWALRLVLPSLSALEIEAMLRNIRSARRARIGIVSAEEFCIHVVAHRLDARVENVARKMKDGWVAELMAAGGGCAVCGRVHEALVEGDNDAGKHPPARS
jgi:hypothetical protein